MCCYLPSNLWSFAESSKLAAHYHLISLLSEATKGAVFPLWKRTWKHLGCRCPVLETMGTATCGVQTPAFDLLGSLCHAHKGWGAWGGILRSKPHNSWWIFMISSNCQSHQISLLEERGRSTKFKQAATEGDRQNSCLKKNTNIPNFLYISFTFLCIYGYLETYTLEYQLILTICATMRCRDYLRSFSILNVRIMTEKSSLQTARNLT